ncbi:hypothetical protein H0H81_010262 [Sphagnurus paluster]|uniref:G-patch domain-containing protein n=1 Tax=Sphagnurus paluster TaxID=117069 RepID=A0A9P7GM25_9AGAR|nr:hypothetical protein H0H81_010262 [Sphagnurus paluster]
MAEKISFTVRRPTPISRAPSSGTESTYKVPALPSHLSNSGAGSPLARSSTSSPKYNGNNYTQHDPDSSEEDDDIRDELVTGFDRFGVQRLKGDRPKKPEPLVIPALKNRDWRDLARKRRSAAQYVPPSAKAETGTDGSVGGLGTRDSINSGPVLSGLQVKARPYLQKHEDDEASSVDEDVKMEEEEDEDKQALRAILAGTDSAENDGPVVHIIPTPLSEADAYKQDVDELPEAATLDDYARVPVSQFGAALLRGMGWKEGTAATRKPGKGLVEPYLPEARPALLGIGAKEREVLDDGSRKKGGAIKRPEKRYVPLVKRDREKDGCSSSAPADRDRKRERSRSPRSSRNGTSAAVSRRSSRSRERDEKRRESSDRRDRDHDRRDVRDRDYRREDRDRDRYRESDRDRRRDRSRDRRR